MKKVILYLKSAVCTARFRAGGVDCSLVACFGKIPALDCTGKIKIGKRFVVRGQVARCEIAAKENARIVIGDRVFVNQGAVIGAAESIEIGDDTLIGDFCAIYDSNYHEIEPGHPDKPRPIVIGRNVWIGSGVLVLPGSEIGDHTVVAARSVVKGTLPPRVLAAGNPAKVVRQLEIPEGWRRG